jgi:hypothetical protein
VEKNSVNCQTQSQNFVDKVELVLGRHEPDLLLYLSSPDDSSTFGDVPDTSTADHARMGSERVRTILLSTCEVTFRLLKGAFHIFLISHIQKGV